MKTITIQTHTTKVVLFSGKFSSFRKCLEAAVRDRISLANADFQNLNLAHMTLDGADLRGANLRCCDLTDTNLSESNLTAMCAAGARFDSTCLCESRLVDINFRGAYFNNALVTDADIDGCVFSDPSALSLPFGTSRLGRNFFIQDGQCLDFTTSPVLIHGLAQRVVFLDDVALIGTQIVPRGATSGLTGRQICLSSPLARDETGPVAKLVDAHDLKS